MIVLVNGWRSTPANFYPGTCGEEDLNVIQSEDMDKLVNTKCQNNFKLSFIYNLAI